LIQKNVGSSFAIGRWPTMTKGKWQIGLGGLILMLSACGHRIQPAPPPRSPQMAVVPLPFIATAYCTGGITASGVPVSRGIAAADPAVLPLGTVIRITGAASYDGTYRVLDTGALVRKRRVDLYIPDCAAARQFGRQSVRVAVIRRPQ
jgi:3D (Asp-Asp-Asp) domain-containing protein